jgi:anti-anti-sigma regulatory factor
MRTMNLELLYKHGFIHINFKQPPQWKVHTFFPLVDSMYKQIKQEWDVTPATLVFNIVNIEYIDSTFISLIIQTTRLTHNQKNVIITPNPQAIDLLTLLGVDRFVDIFHTEEEWAASLQKK